MKSLVKNSSFDSVDEASQMPLSLGPSGMSSEVILLFVLLGIL